MACYSGFDADTKTYDKSSWNYEQGVAARTGALPAKVTADHDARKSALRVISF